MIKLTINGKKITAKKDETVLEVAQRHGIYIPTLCYHKDLCPYGGCRLCIVEVEGWQQLVASCTLPVQDGLKIKTDTPLLKNLRKFTLQLILSEHPHACLICDRGEDCAKYMECIQKSPITFGCKFCPSNNNCELQKLVEYLKIDEIPFDFHYRNLAVEKFDPFFERDYNLCILCGRCVRICQEVRGAATLDFHHRGPDTLVGTAYSLPHLETGCQFCGACVDVCPTGALRERYGKWEALPEKSIKTTCALCNIGCSINLNVSKERLVSSTPANNQICVRGRFGIVPLVYHSRRITRPLLKKGNRLVEVEWEEALRHAASKLDEHKRNISVLLSPQMTTEAIESVYSLADYLKCSIATPIEFDGNVRPLTLKAFKDESVFLVINTDMISDFSPLLLKLQTHSKVKPTIVVIDAFKNKLAEAADLWLQPKPGKELDALKLLFVKGKIRNATGIAIQNIELCKELLNNKNIYLFYNPKNISGIDVSKSVEVVPLSCHINTLKISEMGVDGSIDDVAKNRNIDCLYTIGVVPKLDKNYKTVIVQNCFLPPFDFDVFLPTATFVETGGSIINMEGKIKKLRKAIQPIGKSKPDDWIINQIGKILKYKIKGHKPKRRKKVTSKAFKNIKINKKYPLYLIIRENCYTYQGHPLSALMKGFQRLRSDNCVWINSSTAKKLRLNDGVEINVIGRDLNMRMPVKISDDIPDSSLLVYSHPSMGVKRSQPVRIECIS